MGSFWKNTQNDNVLGNFNSNNMEKKNILEQVNYDEIMERVEKLTPNAQPQWGKMTVAQMLSHVSQAQEVMNGTQTLENIPFYAKLLKGLIKKVVLSEKPYRRSMKTASQYVVTSEQDFEEQKKRIIDALEVFRKQSPEEMDKHSHPLFGKMTPDEKGWSSYKHLDHHLTQFGV